ncbi:hypothetical protein A6F53_07365 [Levilactobacillus brevis]|nr:hypothetical protein A6F53_07365 [Levilactobacillus brevis]
MVGKNNIGKTSTIELLSTLMQGQNFKNNDFSDPNKPIIADLTFVLSDDEIGIFGDAFSLNNANEIEIKFEQKNIEDRLVISHKQSGSEIFPPQIRKANFIEYTSNIRPLRDNDLTENYGEYKLIPQLVNNYVNNSNPSEVKKTNYDTNLIKFINTNLKKIQSFNERKITVDFEMDYADLVTRALSLTDTNGIAFSHLGYGVQFSSLIPLKIIDTIISWTKFHRLDEHLLTTEDGKTQIRIILCIDEPEVHLHPNLQLKMMKYLRKLLNGNDEEFNSLLKELFQIDSIQGQLFSVTHSPDILSQNYHQIERFFIKDNKVSVSSGSELSFDKAINKQLERQFPYFAKALFADAVIIVEGDSELSAFPIFADTLNKSLVDYNVNIVKADGFRSVIPLNNLFKSLDINTILVVDNDNSDRTWPDGTFVTTKKDFEYECFNVMTLEEINEYLSDFENIINDNPYNGNFWFDLLPDKKSLILSSKDKLVTVSDILRNTDVDIQKDIKDKIKQSPSKFIKKYLKNKSIINGQLIANHIQNVPTVYKNAIEEAVNGNLKARK